MEEHNISNYINWSHLLDNEVDLQECDDNLLLLNNNNDELFFENNLDNYSGECVNDFEI